jgi:hypothetical protein
MGKDVHEDIRDYVPGPPMCLIPLVPVHHLPYSSAELPIRVYSREIAASHALSDQIATAPSGLLARMSLLSAEPGKQQPAGRGLRLTFIRFWVDDVKSRA